MTNDRLIKMLRHAHAGEIGAYYAYQGHWESLSDPFDRQMVQEIQQEELEHIHMIEVMLYLLKAQPSQLQDTVFTVIGKTLSILCKFTGYFLPMCGALIIEKIGVANYDEMTREAAKSHMYSLAYTLSMMHQVEKNHEEYFKTCLGRKVGSGR